MLGWMVAAEENARLAQRLIEATCLKHTIGPHQLTIHADRGAPMRSKLVVTSLFEARARLQPAGHFSWSPHGTDWSVRPPVDRRE